MHNITRLCMLEAGVVIPGFPGFLRQIAHSSPLRRSVSCTNPPTDTQASAHFSSIPWEKMHQLLNFSEFSAASCLERQNPQSVTNIAGKLRGHLKCLHSLSEPACYLMSFSDRFSFSTPKILNPSSPAQL